MLATLIHEADLLDWPMLSSLDCQSPLMESNWPSLAANESCVWHRDLFFDVLTEHCYVDCTTEVLKVGSLKTSTLARCTTYGISLFMQTVILPLTMQVLGHCVYWTESATDPLYPHHCALHDTVKHSGCLAQAGLKGLAQVTGKRLTEFTVRWLRMLTASCTGVRS